MMEGLHLFADNQAFFVVTSNGECHFELCGFAPEKIYEVEGNWRRTWRQRSSMAGCRLRKII